jgi:hypothetical protein
MKACVYSYWDYSIAFGKEQRRCKEFTPGSIKYVPTLQYFIENRDIISAARIPLDSLPPQAIFLIEATRRNSSLTSNRVGIKLLIIGKLGEKSEHRSGTTLIIP